MNQVLHIFRKDTRRFWIEIALTLVVLATYALRYPTGWRAQVVLGTRSEMFIVQGLDSLIILLVPAAWWLLVARVIQAEALAGDRQWWVTRPYQWKSLFAAKALFLAVWLYLPLLLAEMTVLHRAGLAPLGHAAHWLFLLSFLSAVVVLPLAGIAAVTSNFARMTLTLLGSIVVEIVFFSWLSTNAPAYWPTLAYPHLEYVVAVVLLGGAAAIMLQYATRRTWLARGLMIGVAVAAAIVLLTLAAMRQGEVGREFPAADAASAAPVQVAYSPTDANRLIAYHGQRNGTELVYVQLPLEFSGVAQGSAVDVENAKFSMDAADGRHWTSPWFGTQPLRYLSGTYKPSLQITIDRGQYEQFKSQPVTLRLTLGLTELHTVREMNTTFSPSDFSVDGLGVCAAATQLYVTHALLCRSEAGEGGLTHLTTTFSNYPCSGPQPALQDVVTGYAWTGSVYIDRFASALTPITLNLVRPEPHHRNGQLAGTQDRTLCPGSPMQFIQYAVTRRAQVSLTIPNFQLPDDRR